VQILVVVATIQLRTLKADVGKGSIEQQLDMGESILRDRLVPFGGDFFVSPAYRKGIGLIFPNQDVDIEW